MPKKPDPPLSDFEVQDVLHRMAFDLQSMTGETVRGDTALKTANRVLLGLTGALIKANEPSSDEPPPLRPEQP